MWRKNDITYPQEISDGRYKKKKIRTICIEKKLHIRKRKKKKKKKSLYANKKNIEKKLSIK